MEWVPIVFLTFKAIVLFTGMFFAIKWHYDQGKKEKEKRAVGKLTAVFVLSLLGLVCATFALARMLGLDLTY